MRRRQIIDDSDSDEDMPLSMGGMRLMNLPAELTYALFTFNGTMLNAMMSVSRGIRNQILDFWDHNPNRISPSTRNFVGAYDRRAFVSTYLPNVYPLSESRTEELHLSEEYGNLVAPRTLKRYNRGPKSWARLVAIE